MSCCRKMGLGVCFTIITLFVLINPDELIEDDNVLDGSVMDEIKIENNHIPEFLEINETTDGETGVLDLRGDSYPTEHSEWDNRYRQESHIKCFCEDVFHYQSNPFLDYTRVERSLHEVETLSELLTKNITQKQTEAATTTTTTPSQVQCDAVSQPNVSQTLLSSICYLLFAGLLVVIAKFSCQKMSLVIQTLFDQSQQSYVSSSSTVSQNDLDTDSHSDTDYSCYSDYVKIDDDFHLVEHVDETASSTSSNS